MQITNKYKPIVKRSVTSFKQENVQKNNFTQGRKDKNIMEIRDYRTFMYTKYIVNTVNILNIINSVNSVRHAERINR
jgi:hypothetical protein